MSYRNALNNERGTPEHDKIMFWLNDNCVEVAKTLFPDHKDSEFYTPEWEKPFLSKGGSILCFIDLSLSFSKKIRPDYIESYELLFEVKPNITSVGEVIRQIKAYKEYVATSTYNNFGFGQSKKLYALVSPDDTYKDILITQDIPMYKIPDGVI